MKHVTLGVLLLAVVGVAGCGDDAQPTDADSEGINRVVRVRNLTAAPALEAWLSLIDDGRAFVSVAQVGGGTDWHGRWAEEGKRLRIRLHRRQTLIGGDYRAPEVLDPPDELLLVQAGGDAWTQDGPTTVTYGEGRLRWTLRSVQDTPEATIEHWFHFPSEDEFTKEMATEEDIPMEPVEGKGRPGK